MPNRKQIRTEVALERAAKAKSASLYAEKLRRIRAAYDSRSLVLFGEGVTRRSFEQAVVDLRKRGLRLFAVAVGAQYVTPVKMWLWSSTTISDDGTKAVRNKLHQPGVKITADSAKVGSEWTMVGRKLGQRGW